jgi:hypothetical protein
LGAVEDRTGRSLRRLTSIPATHSSKWLEFVGSGAGGRRSLLNENQIE